MKAVFRCDASAEIGAGHVVRCLALAQALRREGWSCCFVCAEDSAAAAPALRQDGHELVLMPRNKADDPRLLRDRWPDGRGLLVVDHYGLDAGFETACRGWAGRILVIDDLADREHDCDFLLDSALNPASNNYASLVPGSCRFLFGPRFAPLRPGFREARALAVRRREQADGLSSVLLGFGASDEMNLTPLTMKAIAQSGLDIRIDVVLGAAAENIEEVEDLSVDLPLKVTLFQAVDNMAERMCAADLAFGAAGSTAWERCCLGLPAIMIIAAENQRAIANGLAAAGAAVIIGARRDGLVEAMSRAVGELAAAPARLRKMSQQAFALCDGRGAERVAEALT